MWKGPVLGGWKGAAEGRYNESPGNKVERHEIGHETRAGTRSVGP